MTAINSLDELNFAVRKLGQTESALQEVARIAQQDLARIAVEMSETERLILRKGDILNALNLLQLKAQEKNKGIFESLLTSLVQEVMPGKQDQVVLTSAMKNNRASLDFDILCDGNLENISEDKGGSISNIVAMGLRFIVLARHPNRRVLLLDEADCHLKGEYIPAFAAVMRQLASKMGIQVIYISHHSPANFVGYGRVLELYRDQGKTHARVCHEESEEDKQIESMGAFRYVRLRDYGPHENLFVELSPGLNVITGDIDLGKSKVIQSIVDLMNNNGEERRIRHHRPYMSVELGLEEGMSLHWQYQRKGSKRTLMQLKNEAGEVLETSDIGTSVPEWLDTYLAMPLVNGENIHFQSQKQSNYLLSSTDYTSIKRAEMLPLGRESRDVQRMIQLFNVRLASARQTFAQLQKQMANVKNTLAILAPVLDEPMDLDLLDQSVATLTELSKRKVELAAIAGELEGKRSILRDLDPGLKQLAEMTPVMPELKVKREMASVFANLEFALGQKAILDDLNNLPVAPVMPTLHNLEGLKAMGTELGGLYKLRDMMQSLTDLEQAPQVTLKATDEMRQVMTQATELKQRREQVIAQLSACQQQKTAIAQQKQTLIKALGGICPSCQQPMEGHAHD
jgi:hypothetical protein